MGNRSGLLALRDGMAANFEAWGVMATVGVVSFKERWRQDNQGPGGANRVLLMPGAHDGSETPKSVDGGELTKPRHTHAQVRELAGWNKLVTMSVWAVDASSETAKADAASQIEAVEDLLELAVRAAHNAVILGPAAPPEPLAQGTAIANGGQAMQTLVPPAPLAVGLADIVWGKVRWIQPPVEWAFGLELLVQLVHRGPLFDVFEDHAFPSPVVHRNPPT